MQGEKRYLSSITKNLDKKNVMRPDYFKKKERKRDRESKKLRNCNISFPIKEVSMKEEEFVQNINATYGNKNDREYPLLNA